MEEGTGRYLLTSGHNLHSMVHKYSDKIQEVGSIGWSEKMEILGKVDLVVQSLHPNICQLLKEKK